MHCVMAFSNRLSLSALKTFTRAACLALGVLAGAAGVSQSASAADVVFTVHKITALDAIDVTPADFYVRVVIGGKIHLTPVAKQNNDIEPNWQITQSANGRYVTFFLEVWDKDLQKDDQVDINPRTDRNKRPIEFRLDTRTCRLLDLGGSPRCGDRVTYSGNEKKKATIVFSVTKK